jgi:hypothetical protein
MTEDDFEPTRQVPESRPSHVVERMLEIEIELSLLDKRQVDPLDAIAWIVFGFVLLFVVRAGLDVIAPGNIALVLFIYGLIVLVGWNLTPVRYLSRRERQRRRLERELEALTHRAGGNARPQDGPVD